MSISLATSRVPEISSKRHPEGALKQASPVLLNGHDKQSRRSHKRMAAELIGTVAIKSDKGTSVWGMSLIWGLFTVLISRYRE